MAKVACVEFVRRVGRCGALVGARIADVPDHLLEVVFVFGELAAQLVEQLLVAGGVANTHIVHLIDNALTHKMGPNHVGQVGAKVGVFG